VLASAIIAVAYSNEWCNAATAALLLLLQMLLLLLLPDTATATMRVDVETVQSTAHCQTFE
jgi:hypothetical protein